jgi:hypothetical protein
MRLILLGSHTRHLGVSRVSVTQVLNLPRTNRT